MRKNQTPAETHRYSGFDRRLLAGWGGLAEKCWIGLQKPGSQLWFSRTPHTATKENKDVQLHIPKYPGLPQMRLKHKDSHPAVM